MIHFAHPHLLRLLGILPILALLRGRFGRAPSLVYPSVAVARTVGRRTRSRAGAWLGVLRWGGLALLIVGLARPQVIDRERRVEASGVDIMLAVDVSGSMQARDMAHGDQRLSRLDAVKRVVKGFIEARPNDRIGLIAFSGEPMLMSPLTLNHDWLLANLDRLQPGLVQDGTAIGSALAASTNRLRDQASKSKLVILLTDGANNAGRVQPELAAQAARTLGVKVYTVGVGSRGAAPVPVTDAQGRTHMVMAQVDIDEAALQKIADVTAARFYRATDTEGLGQVYRQIDAMEKTTRTIQERGRPRDRFALAALPAALLLLLELALRMTRHRRIP
jgi:Ca-activated chloride channel family protein